ncbi:MAG: hypothetical protein J6W00_02910 [Lentisphaeria bacterium]|nr:hypothetical protein [Lentisphaeria bacterium]
MQKTFLLFFVLLGFSFSLAADDLGAIAKKYWVGWQQGKMVAKKSASGKLSPADQKKYDKFMEAVRKFAPHWLEEMKSVDKAMGWKPGTYADICVFGVDYKVVPPPHECTSWIIMPDLTGGKQLILHKNRDSSAKYLVGQIRRVPGKYSWLGHGNYGNIGTNCGINNKALVVAMNSGDRTTEKGEAGLNTVHLARILLEECATAESAVKLLEKMVMAGAYNHGRSGSMWFIADPGNAYVVEHNAKHFHAEKVNRGMAIRANAWQFPEMFAYSIQEPKDIVGNVRREYAVRKALLHDIIQKGKVITPADVAHAARIKEFPEDPECYPLCGRVTNAASTFVIDQEFPEDLSFVSFAFGPPRCTFFIPVPLTIDELPEELCNGTTGNEIFKRFQKRHWKKDWKAESELQSVEAKLNARFYKAVEDARKVLRSGRADAKKEAAAILKKAFQENWAAAAEAAKVDSRNWFDKLFDL